MYAQIDDLKPWPEGAEFYSDIYDFAEVYLGQPWKQFLILDDAASIYAHPDEASKITVGSSRSGLTDANGNSVGKGVIEKISRYNSEWYLVNFLGEPDTQFYVRIKDLWIVNW